MRREAYERHARLFGSLARLGLATFVALVVFIGAIYVQDVLQGDLRLPKGCLNETGATVGCPQPMPNLWVAGAIAAASGLVAFRLLRHVFKRR